MTKFFFFVPLFIYLFISWSQHIRKEYLSMGIGGSHNIEEDDQSRHLCPFYALHFNFNSEAGKDQQLKIDAECQSQRLARIRERYMLIHLLSRNKYQLLYSIYVCMWKNNSSLGLSNFISFQSKTKYHWKSSRCSKLVWKVMRWPLNDVICNMCISTVISSSVIWLNFSRHEGIR